LGIAAALLVPRLDAQTSEEGPALGVARVSLTNGDVTMRRGDSGDWVEARVNSPLVEDDVIATGPGSRAEVQLDYSNLIRLNENTEATMASLANRAFRVQRGRGVLTYSELKGGTIFPRSSVRVTSSHPSRTAASDASAATPTLLRKRPASFPERKSRCSPGVASATLRASRIASRCGDPGAV
jgi:hypothetical protein